MFGATSFPELWANGQESRALWKVLWGTVGLHAHQGHRNYVVNLNKHIPSLAIQGLAQEPPLVLLAWGSSLGEACSWLGRQVCLT